MSEMFSRRAFLKASGALVAASALAACSGGGGGSTGGGTGEVPYNPNAYTQITEGLSISKPYMISEGHNQAFKTTSLTLTFGFKNTTNQEITLNKTDFSEIKLNSNDATCQGFGTTKAEQTKIPVSAKDSNFTSVSVTFVPASDSVDSVKNISFTFTYDGNKATCSTDYSGSHWTIKVESKNA